MTRGEFAKALLLRLGVPTTDENYVAMLAWQAGENTRAMHNPLATTRKWARTGLVFNSVGVQNYATAEDGVWATVATITLSYYDAVRAALAKGNNAYEVLQAVASSPWGTGQAALNALDPVRRDVAKYEAMPAGGQTGNEYAPGSVFDPEQIVAALKAWFLR